MQEYNKASHVIYTHSFMSQQYVQSDTVRTFPCFRGNISSLVVLVGSELLKRNTNVPEICLVFNTDKFFWSCYHMICPASPSIERRIPRIAQLGVPCMRRGGGGRRGSQRDTCDNLILCHQRVLIRVTNLVFFVFCIVITSVKPPGHCDLLPNRPQLCTPSRR